MKGRFQKNLLLLLASVLLLFIIGSFRQYTYVTKDLPQSFRYSYNNWNLNREEKLKLRFGATYSYFKHMVDHTPYNAVIIMPPDSILLDKNDKLEFADKIVVKEWASYFVYPRKLVYDREKSLNPLYKKATHIAIVNNWGTHLSYLKNNNMENGVLPLQYHDAP